ncbi:MAG: DUF5777 family beta-barrel protein [Balneolaceae bacterium]|nr:DUF5777 family beta-barrel protein [Balneolaceae bacterium]
MKRERAQVDGPVEETFWAPNIVGMSNVESLPARNLNVTIMHNFGLVNQRTFQNLFGLDFGATVRLGLDYGITDRWSVGVGRTSPQKLYDFRSKYIVIRQTKTNSVPLSVGIKGDLGINTNTNGFEFTDRLNYLASVMLARRFNDRISLQVTPMYAHFNTVFAGQVNDHVAIGLAGEYRLSDRWAVIAEYYPEIGERSQDTHNSFAIGVNIETGGHVFQLFLKSSNWHTEQHILSQTTDNFWDGDIRFGFNVNRIFRIGKN